MEAKTLHLTLKRQWFDMILSGEKLEEYREIKPYWDERLLWKHLEYSTITFRNGYASDAPEMVIVLRGMLVKEGNPQWGATEGVEYYCLILGKILSTKNL